MGDRIASIDNALAGEDEGDGVADGAGDGVAEGIGDVNGDDCAGRERGSL